MAWNKRVRKVGLTYWWDIKDGPIHLRASVHLWVPYYGNVAVAFVVRFFLRKYQNKGGLP